MTVRHDHPEGRPGCDFCTRSAVPAWRYPCRDFVMGDIGPNTHVSTGAWLACEECAALIEADEWEALRHRLLDAYQNQGVDLNRAERRRILSYVTTVHRGFRRHRLEAPRERL